MTRWVVAHMCSQRCSAVRGMANLLVVDDDMDFADAFGELLRVVGHTVRIARNGREGLASIAQQRPDLVVCDVEMPVLDGPGMAYRLFLRDLGDEKIPIVLISGLVDLPRVVAEVGTPYSLAKPFGIKELLAMVDLALAERIPPVPRTPESLRPT